MKTKQKALSPIVATILLVVVSVVLVTITLSWGRGFTNQGLEGSNTILKETTKNYMIGSPKINAQGVLSFKNITPGDEPITITGYKIISSSEDSNFNTIIDFNETTILPGGTHVISIPAFPPEQQITIQLITDQNEYISVGSINNIPEEQQDIPEEESEPESEPQQYNTGALSPGTVVDDATIGTTSWIYPNNSKISDDSYASAEVGVTVVYTAYNTHYLKATNFDFNIPTGATIDGIKVEVEEYASGPLNYSSANIVKANGVVGSTIIYDNNSPSSETNIIFGGDNQLWGETWTAENINDSNFGVAISVRGFSMYCLEENSLISTNQGYKKIKNINIGDLVYSYNETDNKLELKPVTGVWSNPISKINSRYFYIYYNNGEVIKATENHRFYVSGEYKRADELLIGDLLLSQDFQNYAIENIEIIENTTDKVWDIEVEDNHNFFVNDILVHNPPSPLDPTPYYIYVDHIRATVYYTK